LSASREHLHRLFDDLEGFVALGMGFGGRFEGEVYKFPEGGFVESFFPWPEQEDYLLAKVAEHVEKADVYVCPLLRRERSRKQGTGALGRYAWADIDGQAPAGWERGLLGPSSFVVASGRGQHPYIALTDPVEADELEDINKRLARALEADSGWSETKYLRLAGTLNHKPRARGGESAPVDFLEVVTGKRDWTLQELRDLLPAAAEAVSHTNGDGVIEPEEPETVPAHLLERLDEEPSGDRSKQCHTFLRACLDADLNDAEMLALGLKHKPTTAKYGDRAATEITRLIKKFRNNQETLATVETVGGFRGAPEGGSDANSRTVKPVREDGTTATVPLGDVEGGSEQSGTPVTDRDTDAVSAAVEDTFTDPTVTYSEFVARVDENASEPLLVCDQGSAFLCGSLGLLVAKTGDGKTTLAVAFALHASAGLDFAGFSFPRPLRLLVVQNEGPREAFRQKLAAAAAHWPKALETVRVWDEPESWGSVKVSVPEARRRLRRVLELHDVDIVIVDTLTRYGVRGNGTPEETREFIEWLTETGLGRDRGFMLLHHPITRPDSSLELIERIAGAWSPHADMVLYLEKLADKRARLSSVKIRWAREDRPPVLLGFDPETAAFTYLGEQAEVDRDYLAEIVALLRDGKWRIVREINNPKEAGGIGADYDLVKGLLEAHPDVFESRTGEDAKALGRKATATVWQLRPKPEEDGAAPSDDDAVDPARVIGACNCGRPIVRGTGNTATKCGKCAKAGLRYSDGGVS
jgi:hypothetical protein